MVGEEVLRGVPSKSALTSNTVKGGDDGAPSQTDAFPLRWKSRSNGETNGGATFTVVFASTMNSGKLSLWSWTAEDVTRGAW